MTDQSPGVDSNLQTETPWREPEGVRPLADELVPIFYDELRAMARNTRRRISPGATVQTTELVNETYLKLRRSRAWNDDGHFLCAAAIAMRHVLVDHAKARTAAKRGSGAQHVPLELAENSATESDEMLIRLNDALARLADEAPRLAAVVECRYFGGYDDVSTARALNLSDRTVRRDWTLARAWLHRELQSSGDLLPAG